MNEKQIFYEDLEIARAIIGRDERVTREYFYRKYYPLFKSIYDKYYTDCSNVKEFTDEIYLLVMTPSKITGKRQLENYRGESTLFSWVKLVALTYCFKKFKKKIDVAKNDNNEEKTTSNDSFVEKTSSIELDFANINSMDAETLINLMPNLRYRAIIRLRYIEEKSNEETAQILGMSMDNYYNNHKRAKEQYLSVLRKEENHG